MMALQQAFLVLIAAQHFGFLVLEMFFWTKPLGLKVFRQSLAQAEASRVLAANQGLYNGFLSAGLIWALIEKNSEIQMKVSLFFLTCVLLAGLYGAKTVNLRIFWIQGLPALIAILITCISLSYSFLSTARSLRFSLF